MANGDGAGEHPATHESVTDTLLALRAIDTEGDQLTLRRERVPERAEMMDRSATTRAWEERRRSLRGRLDELERAIDAAEAESASLNADKLRLEGQLKTVIAPREAEALMHEIDTIAVRRDDLDAAELTALEEQAVVDDELSAHLALEADLRESYRAAERALAERLADLDQQLAAIADRRDTVRSALPADLLARYDTVRAQQGVAVARLEGRRCDGCHLDLSAAEVDDARDDAAETGITECPHCGRLLVV